ncbi:hypothetical protein DV515_00009641 [Chloebia gouldiae]|uniref:Uncharacterized protein n=1 Tax=Chloebia gouldiae TaxID=44316 RepID=A0A3L8SAW4_CHLGU|nr:hypothetical protein DV515_00009641 [Chloebia gouldiae]
MALRDSRHTTETALLGMLMDQNPWVMPCLGQYCLAELAALTTMSNCPFGSIHENINFSFLCWSTASLDPARPPPLPSPQPQGETLTAAL